LLPNKQVYFGYMNLQAISYKLKNWPCQTEPKRITEIVETTLLVLRYE